MGDDPTLKEGKNIIHFTLIYCMGRYIRLSKVKDLISLKTLLWSYLCVNVIICILNYSLFGSVLQQIMFKLSFFYNSPFLILNAIILFLIFIKMKIHSKVISRIAKCTFSIYLIHSNIYIGNIIWNLSYPHTGISSCVILGLMMFTLCIFIDLILNRVYGSIADILYCKINTISNVKRIYFKQ